MLSAEFVGVGSFLKMLSYVYLDLKGFWRDKKGKILVEVCS